MSRRVIVTPRDADMQNLSPAFRRWVLEVSRSLNGGQEGRDVLGQTVTPSLSSLSAQVTAVSQNVAQVASTSTGLTAIPSRANLESFQQGAGLALLDSVTLTITGGTAPYGVVWSDPDALGIVFSAPSSATTAMSVNLFDGQIVVGSVRARVTDAAMTQVDAFVSINAQSFGSISFL
jgi:hypothetical protein